MWKEQPLFGFGFKSFRFKCWKMLEKDNEERKITKEPQRINCSNHPHNYYIQMLAEVGLIGPCFLIFLVYQLAFIIKVGDNKRLNLSFNKFLFGNLVNAS